MSTAPADNPRSTLAVPISVSAAFLARALDEMLDRIRPEPGLLYRKDRFALGAGAVCDIEVWRRGDCRVAMRDDSIHATLPVRVVVKPAWQPRLGPLRLRLPLPLPVSAEYQVHLRSQPHLDSDYNLQLNADFSHEVQRAAGLTLAGIDLAFTGATRRAADEALTALGNWINSADFRYLNLREQAWRGWQALQQPFSLSPEHHFRLAVAPEGVHARPFRTRQGEGVIELAVVAHVRAEADVAAPHAVAPLPPVSAGDAGDGVSLSLPLEISFAALEAALRANVAHHPWRIGGRELLLHEVQLGGSDDGELRVQATLDIGLEEEHRLHARIAAGGRPQLDDSRQHLALADFHYALDSDSTLLNVAASLLQPFADNLLESWLSLPLEPQAVRLLAEANARLVDGIVLAPGVTLRGHADGVQLGRLTIHSRGLSLTVSTRGQLAVILDDRPARHPGDRD